MKGFLFKKYAEKLQQRIQKSFICLLRILKQRNIGVTPHIGASTKEAQARIAIELADKIKDCYNKNQVTQ